MKKSSDAYALIQTNQYNTFRQILRKKFAEVKNKILEVGGLVTTAVSKKFGEVENKLPSNC